MATFYYFDLKPLSGFRLPVRASTLWGHLSWAIRELEGAARLEQWIRSHEEALMVGKEPPLRLSSAFPKGFLPRPFLRPLHVEETSTRKALKSLRYIPIETLPDLFQEGELALQKLVASKADSAVQALIRKPRTRVAVDRRTGSAAEGLLFEEALYWSKGILRVYARLGDGITLDHLEGLIEHVGRVGFGGGASVGNGVFVLESKGVEELPEGSGPYQMLLGPGLLPSKPEGWWKAERYWGRMGSVFSGAAVPFKRPYLRVIEGSVLKNHVPLLLDVTPPEPPEKNVRVLENLAPLTLLWEVSDA